MVYCLNPRCPNPQNPDHHRFCQSCGSQLLLRNRYRALKLIGGGGFGKTYQAEDTDCLNASCVVKQFSPSPAIQADPAALQKATELFNQEAVRLFHLGEHPQIPRLLAYFEQDKRLYLVQELIDGQDLLTELQQQGTFSEQKIRQLLAELLPVLKVVHESGVIHRDIKPDNIMRRRTPSNSTEPRGATSPPSPPNLGGTTPAPSPPNLGGTTPSQSPPYPGRTTPAPSPPDQGGTTPAPSPPNLGGARGGLVLIDFGVSKQVTGTIVGGGTTVGTSGYAPIEQLRGQVCPASDLYSLGVTCVSLLTGCLPGTSDFKKLYDGLEDRWKWREYLPPGTSVSHTLGQVLDKLLQERVKDRYQSADEVLQALTDDLSSAVGIDYSHLRDLLAALNWKEAEEETRTLMLKAAFREKEGWLTGENFKKFPPTDLRTINQLWLKYSNGRLGPVPASVLQAITDDLSSAVGVDYSLLRHLLAAGKWKEADAETVSVMLSAAGRTKEGWIDINSIKKFPCIDLLTIDRLWVKYSNGHFGFSVQKSIWDGVGGKADANGKTYEKFCDIIGWHGKGDLLYYSNLTFDITAPKGHLPSGRAGDIALLVRLVGKFGGFGVERVSSLASRLASCGI